MLVGVKLLALCIKRSTLTKSVSLYGTWPYNLVKMIKEISSPGIARCFSPCAKPLTCWAPTTIPCCGATRAGTAACIVYLHKCRAGMGRVLLCTLPVIILVNILRVRDERHALPHELQCLPVNPERDFLRHDPCKGLGVHCSCNPFGFQNCLKVISKFRVLDPDAQQQLFPRSGSLHLPYCLHIHERTDVQRLGHKI